MKTVQGQNLMALWSKELWVAWKCLFVKKHLDVQEAGEIPQDAQIPHITGRHLMLNLSSWQSCSLMD